MMDFILEIGVNHENSVANAELMIDQASECVASAVKCQAYKAELLASVNSPAYWDQSKETTSSQFELFRKYDKFDISIYRHLQKYALQKGLEFLLTCFDLQTLQDLDYLVARHKIASADITNKPLLTAAAKTGKDILLSTGAATFQEIHEALSWIRQCSSAKITLLHCVLNYPTPTNLADLGRIKELQEEFSGVEIGYSDHVVPDTHMIALTTAYQLGVRVFEKHFTFDKNLPGNDHYHSADKADVLRFFDIASCIDKLMIKGNIETQADARKHARRSLVAAKDLIQGHHISHSDLVAKRPGHGISPALIDSLIGRVVSTNIPQDTILEWNMFME